MDSLVMTASNVQYAVESCALVDACKPTLLHSLPMRLTTQQPDQLPKHSPVVKPATPMQQSCVNLAFLSPFFFAKMFLSRLFPTNPD
jgi:hypothetical protein